MKDSYALLLIENLTYYHISDNKEVKKSKTHSKIGPVVIAHS